MKITYDPRHNIAYLRLEEKSAEVETIHVSDELNTISRLMARYTESSS